MRLVFAAMCLIEAVQLVGCGTRAERSRAAAPPSEAPPPAASRPTRVRWVPTNCRVLFGPGDATVTAPGRAMIREALDARQGRNVRLIRVEGYAGQLDEAPDGLDLRRAEAVADDLVAQGIPRETIEVVGRGVETACRCSTCHCDLTQDLRVEVSLLVVEPSPPEFVPRGRY
jgi:outer membrane protein OmpA-like peptidoglycan-associated protein